MSGVSELCRIDCDLECEYDEEEGSSFQGEYMAYS